MKDRVIVPISLGGSQHRCVLSPAPRKQPSAEYVHAMIESYKERWGHIDEVAFFDGRLPSVEHLSVIGNFPWRLSIQPVDLSRKSASWIVEKGIRTLELEILSLLVSQVTLFIGLLANFFKEDQNSDKRTMTETEASSLNYTLGAVIALVNLLFVVYFVLNLIFHVYFFMPKSVRTRLNRCCGCFCRRCKRK